jgi:hypothetical protein
MRAPSLIPPEQKLGGLNAFLPYIRSYVSTFAGQSIDAYQWKDHLYEFWTKTGGDEAVKILDSIDWAAWFDGESVTLPEYPTYDTTLIDEVRSVFLLSHRCNFSFSDHRICNYSRTSSLPTGRRPRERPTSRSSRRTTSPSSSRTRLSSSSRSSRSTRPCPSRASRRSTRSTACLRLAMQSWPGGFSRLPSVPAQSTLRKRPSG